MLSRSLGITKLSQTRNAQDKNHDGSLPPTLASMAVAHNKVVMVVEGNGDAMVDPKLEHILVPLRKSIMNPRFTRPLVRNNAFSTTNLCTLEMKVLPKLPLRTRRPLEQATAMGNMHASRTPNRIATAVIDTPAGA